MGGRDDMWVEMICGLRSDRHDPHVCVCVSTGNPHMMICGLRSDRHDVLHHSDLNPHIDDM